ncbi:MAG: hypothetical protein AAGM67_20095 [Bacteroidota bacterium]
MSDNNAKVAQLLFESGLLFEINRRYLHSKGMAISITMEEDGTVRGFGPFYQTDDPDGMWFDEETTQIGVKKLKDLEDGSYDVRLFASKDEK